MREGYVYLPDYHAAILHIPKTGGMWMRAVVAAAGVNVELRGNSCIHDAEYVTADRPDVRTFCCVRNPMTWLQSYWADRQLNGWGGDLRIAHDCQDDDFNEFARKVETIHPGFVGELFDRYTRGATHVGAFESIGQYLFNVFAFLEVSGSVWGKLESAISQVPPVNVCGQFPAMADRSKYRPDVARLVVQHEQAAFVKYGYPLPSLFV